MKIRQTSIYDIIILFLFTNLLFSFFSLSSCTISTTELKTQDEDECKLDNECPNHLVCEGRYKFYKNENIIGPTTMTVKRFCAIPVGGPCKNFNGEEQGVCVWNAVCDPISNICLCDGTNNVSGTTSGKCRMNYAIPCVSGDCNPDKHFFCRQNKCDCVDITRQGYSEIQGRCVGLPGEMCDLIPLAEVQLGCGSHATCSNNTSINEYHGKCECEPGYYSDHSRNEPDCMPTYGSYCNSTDLCAHGMHLTCKNFSQINGINQGICQCDSNAKLEIINFTVQNYCTFKEGVDCNEDSICTNNARCVRSICQCNFGFSKTPIGTCKLDYNILRCNINEDQEDPCNEFIGLKCIKNSCKCSNGLIFDDIFKKCVIQIGDKCDPENKDFVCPNFGFCNSKYMKCTCSKLLMPNPWKSDPFCYPSIGAICNRNNSRTSCSGGKYLKCSETKSICECDDTISLFEENTSSCYLKAGKKCKLNENHADICVSHAVCENHICKCTTGYTETKNGKCRLNHMELCNPFLDECNPDAFLSCTQILDNDDEYRCECSTNIGNIYDKNKKSCVILNGFNCSTYIGSAMCSKNSNCVSISNSQSVCKCIQNFTTTNSTNHLCIRPCVDVDEFGECTTAISIATAMVIKFKNIKKSLLWNLLDSYIYFLYPFMILRHY